MEAVENLTYSWLPSGLIDASNPLFVECAALYSSHYGVWATDVPEHGGKRVKLSPQRIRELLKSDDASVAYARDDRKLVGYAIAIRTRIPRRGVITWVTQLVVHETYRHRGVAKRLLFSLWSFSNHYAWGLVSANPYAVRALEKATRRRCDPERIEQHVDALLALGPDHIPYISLSMGRVVSIAESRLNTEFFLDHGALREMIANATSEETPWRLGNLPDGWEWFAFTFNDQPSLSLSSSEIAAMLNASDDVVREAYGRMTLDKKHKWASHTDAEAQFVVETCGLRPGDRVADFGCGNGRHSIALHKKGMRVTGVDSSEELIARSRQAVPKSVHGAPLFLMGDCRDIDLGQQYDCAICLYDVVGSYPQAASNFKILRNLARHVRPGGTVLLSVMNWVLTESIATQFFSLEADPGALQLLKPSGTMESTGNILNPDFFMADRKTQIVYRKEQFDRGRDLPTELIVRDRRYTPKEIGNLCVAVGLDVVWARCVKSGDWDLDLPPTNPKAKEILVFCRKAYA